jgi:hypothetical protein
MRIDIGGGRVPVPDHINLDPIHGEGEFRRRIQDGIPAPDGSVESVYCAHLLEHVPAQDRIDTFNEVWRVLVPGGTFDVIVPLFPSWGAIADPTHVSFWVRQSFDYFTGAIVPGADYGIRPWQWVEWAEREWDWGIEGHATLRKPE